MGEYREIKHVNSLTHTTESKNQLKKKVLCAHRRFSMKRGDDGTADSYKDTQIQTYKCNANFARSISLIT